MIYFLRSNNNIKIGYTEHPKDRIDAIQTSNPNSIECLLLISGGKDKELSLHQRFQKDRIRQNGEWFKYSQPIIDFINDNIKDDRRYEFGLLSQEFQSNEQLRRLRLDEGYTLLSLASKLNITASSLSESEKREADGKITINKLKEIGATLGYILNYRFIKT